MSHILGLFVTLLRPYLCDLIVALLWTYYMALWTHCMTLYGRMLPYYLCDLIVDLCDLIVTLFDPFGVVIITFL